jgi:hypothetical protein
MDDAKKKRLEKRGWKISNVTDFLNLSEDEARLVEKKLSARRAKPEPRRQSRKKSE